MPITGDGGEGAAECRQSVVRICDEGKAGLKALTADMPLFEKIRTGSARESLPTAWMQLARHQA